MKSKLLVIVLTLLIATVFGGCGAEPAKVQTITGEDINTEQAVTEQDEIDKNNSAIQDNEVQSEDRQYGEIEDSEVKSGEAKEDTIKNDRIDSTVKEEQDAAIAETGTEETTDFTFADLSKRQFEFCSGAGAWSEDFTIEKDGYFQGNYHDSDMGVTGEGYADGTRYSSSYSGHFTDLTKINDYTYQMKLKDITYKDTPGKERIWDNTRVIYTESYCLGGTDTFLIYLPGTPLSELSEEVRMWLSMGEQSETELTMIAIVDEYNEYGIYSYDRAEPLEDAQMTFNSFKYSYDYYNEMLSEVDTTMEMLEYSGAMYTVSDNCLNYLWNLIRYNVDEGKYQEILAEQREWIANKEEQAKKESEEFGGTFSMVVYNDTLATLTIKRCEELIEYLK